MSFTISYITNRREPKFEWFAWSLAKQGGTDIPVNVIDYHADNSDRRASIGCIAKESGIRLARHSTPKPTVWQGRHRLTKADCFAAANASNTAIALCPTEWIVFVDDLSVLRPGWLGRVKEAVKRTEITCGAYEKVLELVVEKGEAVSWKEHNSGKDIRMRQTGPDKLTACTGSWFFGCSFVAPVEALLTINGFDEDTDGMGYQDCLAGLMLNANGYQFVYDSGMVTFESEELHGQPGNVFHRWDPGTSPEDKSHKILELFANGRTKAPNYFGPDGLRGLREHVMRGNPFPVVSVPQHEWFTGRPLSSLPDNVEEPIHGPFERKLS